MKSFLEKYERRGIFEVLEFPSQSPDLNWIENIWPVLNRRTENRNPKSDADLFDILAKKWMKFKPKELRPFAESMPKRIRNVKANEGYYCGK